MGNSKKAIKLHTQARDIYVSNFGNNHPIVASCIRHLGLEYQAIKKYKKAYSLFTQALEIRKEILDKTDERIGESHHDVAVLLHHYMGDYKGAENHYKLALKLRENAAKVNANFKLKFADTLYKFSTLLYHKKNSQYDLALDYCKQALRIRKKMLDNDDPKIAACLLQLCKLETKLGMYDNALNNLEQALKIRRKAFGKDSTKTKELAIELLELKMKKHASKVYRFIRPTPSKNS